MAVRVEEYVDKIAHWLGIQYLYTCPKVRIWYENMYSSLNYKNFITLRNFSMRLAALKEHFKVFQVNAVTKSNKG